ncbi:MAG: type I-MYXAN CRISPR-associated protein Cas5/Cmx5/DevS [Acidobacteriota bacterium]
MKPVFLSIETPIASFRMPYAREFAESYEIPPPATVYGMLLSLVGEENRYKHIGVRIAIARPDEYPKPERSVVLRTFRRVKKKPISDPTNARPDFQEVLTGIYLGVWVDSSNEANKELRLTERLIAAFTHPQEVNRFGGLSLGESRDLIDSVSLLIDFPNEPNNPFRFGAACHWLMRKEYGSLTMPYWVDHVGSIKTLWESYQLVSGSIEKPHNEYWTEIKNNR